MGQQHECLELELLNNFIYLGLTSLSDIVGGDLLLDQSNGEAHKLVLAEGGDLSTIKRDELEVAYILYCNWRVM